MPLCNMGSSLAAWNEEEQQSSLCSQVCLAGCVKMLIKSTVNKCYGKLNNFFSYSNLHQMKLHHKFNSGARKGLNLN